MQQKSITVELLTGCGKIFITRTERGLFVPHTSKEFMEKSPCGLSNLWGICDLLNLHNDKKYDLREISEAFRGHGCDRKLIGKNAKSCSDAVARMVMEFEKKVDDKKEEEKK